MTMPTAIFLIVAMSLCIPLYALRVKAQSRRGNQRSNEREEQIDRELAALRDRVETLERIVTDGRYDLDREFDNLRAGARRSG